MRGVCRADCFLSSDEAGMKHPTPEQLKPLIDAVDVACWALAVKQNTKKGQRCKADVKGALADLQEAWGMFQLSTSDGELITEEIK